MAWQITIAGTVDVDDITIPTGEARGLLGGSAVYAGLAASRFARVLLHGSVGSDYASVLRAAVNDLNIDIKGVSVSRSPTRRWRAAHDFARWETSSEDVEGGDATWSPVLTTDASRAPVLCLASMAAQHQLETIKQSTGG